MNRATIVALAALVLAGCSNGGPSDALISEPAVSSPTVDEVTFPTIDGDIASDLAAPWSVVPLADGSALISERDSARILLLRDGRTTVIGNPAQVLPEGEGGLLGLAVRSPDPKRVYAYYTAATDNRVVVFDFDGTALTNERTVLGGIPKGVIHNGGRIAFGPDGYLYVATGETGVPELAQDRRSLAGKILRVTPSGNPAPDNPDPTSPVWSYGHRNVQGLAWDTDGQLWASEFGQEDVDELNLIEPGRNYGWPMCEGACDIPGMTNPKATWSPTATSSPSGLAILNGSAWVAALRGQALYEVRLLGTSASEPKAWFAEDLGRLRDVVATPEGNLWVVTNNTDGRGSPRAGDDRIVEVVVPQ
ncbi:MAG: PQQ-dependent sugar dehydrogenase [Candidatus Nanopelagicales bacterium]|jgi:glucose/arabinose dehydrogenase|nr:PQQ-dependent sugar dehydrogenase [Candidatus Nanopelagicales bacterium]MCU0297641.1 PQQ-dependent sugar dehydrogenase [Candidatus Nanopelagicales bacterium]